MKSYGIFSPILGLRKDIPSILLKEAYAPDCKDIIWQNGEVHRIRKRLREFGDKRWDCKYNANELPESASPSWTKDENVAGGRNIKEIASGKLRLVSPSGSRISYSRDESSLSNATGTTIEASIKFIKAADAAHISLIIRDGAYSAVLEFYEYKIRVPGGSGINDYYMNTSDDYHTYRMTSKSSGDSSTDVKVYVDDRLVIETTITQVTTYKKIIFGKETEDFDTEAYIDWVYYRIDGAFPSPPKFPDKILAMEYYFKDTTTERWFLVFTKRDIAYRDINNDRFVFINKIYNQGTITSAQQNSGGTFTLTFSLPSGEDLQTETKKGDFIRLDNKTAPYTSNDMWYEVDSVDAYNQITVIGTKPPGFPASGGSDYAIRKTFSGSDLDYWSVLTFHEKVLATNRGVDKIIIWQGADQVSDLDCAHKATFLYDYNERVLLIRTIEGGVEHPFRIRWSGLADETDWGGSGSDAGSMEVNEGEGILQGCAVYKGNLLIFKNRAIVRAWNVEGIMVFNKKMVLDSIGTNAPDSILEMEEGTYFYSGDNTFRFFDGLVARVISIGIDPIVKNINPSFKQYIQVTMIEELNQILWAIPEGDNEINNKVLIYDLDFMGNNWGVEDMEVASLGYYGIEEVYDWGSLSIFDNWLDWWWPSWKYRAGLKTFPIDLMGTYDGRIYRLNASEKDAGEDYTGYQVLQTDLGGGMRLSIFDRLLLIQAYVRHEASGILGFYIKRDDEANWQYAGSVNLAGDREILIRELPVDFLAKTFKIKVSGQNRFRFLGAILKYEEVGER